MININYQFFLKQNFIIDCEQELKLLSANPTQCILKILEIIALILDISIVRKKIRYCYQIKTVRGFIKPSLAIKIAYLGTITK